MELYLKVYFYIGLVSVILQLLLIVTTKYPRIAESSVGSDIVKLFITSGFFAWTTYLYFGN